ncbi:MAG: 50S ribosomal protein L9 [Spirochaetaceae bacterium]
MKIILNEDVYNLGEEGDVCDVARGYARNYLFPKDLAVPHTKENIAKFESRRAAIDKRKEEKRKTAQTLKERLEGMELKIPMNAGEAGKLFGSVTSAMIVEELSKMGIELEKKQVEVPSSSIKMTGDYKVLLKLYESESAEITINVVDRNKPEAEQKKDKETTPKASGETSEPSEEPLDESAEESPEAAAETVEADTTEEESKIPEESE